MISDLSGFSSPKVLARLFRAVESTTLRDYRRRLASSARRSARR